MNNIYKKKGLRNKLERLIYTLLMEKEYYHWNRQLVNICHPKLYTEKINYLRIYNYCNNPKVTECVDKYEVKKYLKRLGKENLCAKTYGVYNRAEEIQWGDLPDRFVIKCNHGSGYNYVCVNKNKIDKKQVIDKLNCWMKEDYWKLHTELVYKNVKKRILVEEYLGTDIQTYRFCCFNGKPKIVYIITIIDGKAFFDYYDLHWKKLKMNESTGTDFTYEKPLRFKEMLELAAEFSKPFPFVRVDLYEIDGKIYFSEFTFLPSGGYFVPFPKEFNERWGRWLKISQKG